MRERWNHWIESAGGVASLGRWALALVAAGVLWFDPSSGVAKAILWGTGLYALWNGRKTLAAWKNPVGAFFGLGVLWALASTAWSFYPKGTALDLFKSAPMVLAAMALPMIFDRPRRIWTALLVGAGMVTMRLAIDLARVWAELGWPEVLKDARFLHPYLYTHPNVSSMMAGLCVLVFVARGLAGAPGFGRKVLLVVGIVLNLIYMVVMASRGPQAVFALVALAFPIVLLPGWRARLTAALLAVVLAFMLWEVLPKVNPRFRDPTMANFNQRNVVWAHAKMLADQRPVLGYGFGKKAFEKAVYQNPEHLAPRTEFRYMHAHSYWLMLYFQGGAFGGLFWSLGWLALALRLGRVACRSASSTTDWHMRLQERVLPVLLGTGISFILIYGIGDYPDSVIRQVQFYLSGLAMALTLVSTGRQKAMA
jgi:O-antigen ligase